MKFKIALILLLATPAFAAQDPIVSLVARLSASHGLWQNGMFSPIKLPESASAKDVIKAYMDTAGFDKGRVKKFHVVHIKKVQIAGALPDQYSAALIDTDLGQKIVLFQYQKSLLGWWARAYDAQIAAGTNP